MTEQFTILSAIANCSVISTLNKYGVKGDEFLLIMTVNQATLDEVADFLPKLGVKNDIITVDGDRVTYLFNSQRNIIVPQLSNLQENPTFRHLPDYLGFRKKSKNLVVPKISIGQLVKYFQKRINLF